MTGIFITGTDTDVGKTFVSSGLLTGIRSHGFLVAGMKPVASGCAKVNGELKNDDALMLLNSSDSPLAYHEVNPYALSEPVSPNIASKVDGQTIDLTHIRNCLTTLEKRFQFLVVEGIGGWETPLGERSSVADMARQLNLPILLVVGLKVGCINHAILTERAIVGSGCNLIGWIANQCDPNVSSVADIYSSLTDRLTTTKFGLIPFVSSASRENHADTNSPSHSLAFQVLRTLGLLS